MARPTLLTHRKFRRLVARLNGDTATAIGSLELIWLASYESGDDVVGDASDVEAAAFWRGGTGVLAAALADAGFLDFNGDTYTVHDLDDHAPEYVQKRRARELSRRERGVTLRELRAMAGEAGGKQTASKRQANGVHVSPDGEQAAGKRQANGGTPAPAPSPAPAQNTNAQPPAERVLFPAPAKPRFDLDLLYKGYPRKESKAEGMRKMATLIKSDADYQQHITAIANLNARIARDKLELRHVPHFSTWANGKWEDYRDGIPASTAPAQSASARAPATPEHRPDVLRPFGAA